MREFDGIAASNKFQMRSLYEFLAESDVAFKKPEVRETIAHYCAEECLQGLDFWRVSLASISQDQLYLWMR